VVLLTLIAVPVLGCGSRDDRLRSVGIPRFQELIEEARIRPGDSDYLVTLDRALSGDPIAIRRMFNKQITDADFNDGGAEEVIYVFTVEAILVSVGEDRFLDLIRRESESTQRTALAALDERVLRGEYPKVSAHRAALFGND